MTTLHTTPDAPLSRRPGWRLRGLALGIVVLCVLLAIGIIPRVFRAQEAARVVQDSPVITPGVTVVSQRLGPTRTSVTLPGNLQPLYAASIYARTRGYIERRFVDIGAHVKESTLLAVISSPEVDQQLDQARAALQQAIANREIARITRDRYAPLLGRRAVTPQSLDEANKTLDARVADVAAAQANVRRLLRLQGFERVVAPFDGVITARHVEQGDLVDDGSGTGTRSLFDIAQSTTLRVQVEVPQSSALAIQTGQKATLAVSERPGRRYVATVARSAESVDLAARTMLTEVQVDNRDGSLLPGMYGEITFDVTAPRPSVIIPSVALVIDKNGTHVVTVSSDDIVHFVPVEIGQDLGAEVEIAQGLTGHETLVGNPSDLLSDGQKVIVTRQ
jgi:RND family efflux transporter MFP subunit